VSRRHSLRIRLTALFVVGAGGTMVAAAIAMSMLLQQVVWRQFDGELSEEAETISQLLDAGAIDDVGRAASAIVSERTPGPGKFIEVADADGRVLASVGHVPPAVVVSELPDPSGARTVRDSRGSAYRVFWYAGRGPYRVVVGARTHPDPRTLHYARVAIVVTASALIFALSFLAWTITGRVTSELGRMADEIETIEAGSLTRRLAPRRTPEVDRLAGVLNRLLERLDTAVTHLRRFSADAAHELRTPLAGLRARIEVTLGGPASERAYREGLLDALEQTERLGTLAEHLLALTAIEAGVDARPLEPVRLDSIAWEVTESLEAVAQEQGRRFECIAPAPVTVVGRALLLKRLLLNLVDNAFRHTPPAAAVRLEIATDSAAAIVSVRDEGPGIPADELPRVFDPFHRGSGNGGGGGLGLALCREIVVQHRGTISVESDHGTTVTVRLPI